MKINREDVLYMAKLAKLKFNDEEALELAKEFEGILKHFDSLKESELELDNTELKENTGPTVFREDEVEDFEDIEGLLLNVKDKERGYVKIPKVIE